MPILEKDPQNKRILKLPKKERDKVFLELVRKTEGKILAALDFDLSRVVVFDFLSVFYCDLGELKQKKKVFDFAHFLLLILVLNKRFSCLDRSLLAFSALYLSNRLFGSIKDWPKLKNSHYKLVNGQMQKQESIFASLHFFELVRGSEHSVKKKPKRGLSKKKSFTDLLINKINHFFSNKPGTDEKKNQESVPDTVNDPRRIRLFKSDKFVGFASVDQNKFSLELSFNLKLVKQTSVSIFSGWLTRVQIAFGVSQNVEVLPVHYEEVHESRVLVCRPHFIEWPELTRSFLGRNPVACCSDF